MSSYPTSGMPTWDLLDRLAGSAPSVLRDLAWQLREEYVVERLEVQRANARANEAARLSAEARDEVADRDKTIADLNERIAVLEQGRLNLDAWAVDLAAKHHAGYRERPDNDPHGAIEEALVSRFTFLRLIASFVDPDECSFDHHGNCTHGAGVPCPHAEAKAVLAAEGVDR